MADVAAVEAFKAKHYLNDDDLAALQAITLPPEREGSGLTARPTTMCATGCAVKRPVLRRENPPSTGMTWFLRWTLLKSQEINPDYILELIFEHNKKIKSKSELVEEVRRVIRASLGNQAKRVCWWILSIRRI